MPMYDCGASDCDECQRAFGPDRSRAIANYKAREAAYAKLEQPMPKDETPPCRICRGRHEVVVYDTKRREDTICQTCCETAMHADGETGHVWEYERSERGNVCQKCGIPEHADDDGGISDRERI